MGPFLQPTRHTAWQIDKGGSIKLLFKKSNRTKFPGWDLNLDLLFLSPLCDFPLVGFGFGLLLLFLLVWYILLLSLLLSLGATD